MAEQKLNFESLKTICFCNLQNWQNLGKPITDMLIYSHISFMDKRKYLRKMGIICIIINCDCIIFTFDLSSAVKGLPLEIKNNISIYREYFFFERKCGLFVEIFASQKCY